MSLNFGAVTTAVVDTIKLFHDISGDKLMLLQEWIQPVKNKKIEVSKHVAIALKINLI